MGTGNFALASIHCHYKFFCERPFTVKIFCVSDVLRIASGRLFYCDSSSLLKKKFEPQKGSKEHRDLLNFQKTCAEKVFV